MISRCTHLQLCWCAVLGVPVPLPLRSLLCKTAIRGLFANDTAGKASSVFKITLRVILMLRPCSTVYLYMQLPRRAVGHGAVPVCRNTQTGRARAGFAGVPSFLCMCKEKTAVGALPIPNACLWYILQSLQISS